jgi:hypothetical protein
MSIWLIVGIVATVAVSLLVGLFLGVLLMHLYIWYAFIDVGP